VIRVVAEEPAPSLKDQSFSFFGSSLIDLACTSYISRQFGP
jgi:hypothetical protein